MYNATQLIFRRQKFLPVAFYSMNYDAGGNFIRHGLSPVTNKNITVPKTYTSLPYKFCNGLIFINDSKLAFHWWF